MVRVLQTQWIYRILQPPFDADDYFRQIIMTLLCKLPLKYVSKGLLTQALALGISLHQACRKVKLWEGNKLF